VILFKITLGFCDQMPVLAKALTMFYFIKEACHDFLNIGQNGPLLIKTKLRLVAIRSEICLLYAVANSWNKLISSGCKQ
jgi:hypothetical protein